MSITELPLIKTYREAISEALKNTPTNVVAAVKANRKEEESDDERTAHNAAIETVFRELFVEYVAQGDLSQPDSSQMRTLIDAVNTLSDNELCEPSLGFYLIEELLDSSTIDECRKVFDYLESRRERMTRKHWKAKHLVILRCCNELLRRLSRAEDTVFCGRVFIYLFQSFPLGDKSSVNLRGEFHVENVTMFDEATRKSDDAIQPMEIDTEANQTVASRAQTPSSTAQEVESKTGRSTPLSRLAKSDNRAEPPPDLDALYPVFWSLQALFSSPTDLFNQGAMQRFKDGISSTMSCFKYVANNTAPSSGSSDVQRGTKRKRGDDDHIADSSNTSKFNPKYLTNRDLFDLEIQDIAFRRHILVQALILLDFLLSLSPASKAKMVGLTNKSVLYAFTLSEEDTKWAQTTRASIATYLQQGNGTEGKFYYRMVDTVLSRDKNWTRWKAENCPKIERSPVDVKIYLEAQKSLQELTKQTTLPQPPGANDLSFLSRSKSLEALKHPSKRYQIPSLSDYYKSIQGDELDMEMAMDDQEKSEIEERMAGKLWRALRAAQGRRFVLCDQIKNGENLKALVETTPTNGVHNDDREAEDQDDGTVETGEESVKREEAEGGFRAGETTGHEEAGSVLDARAEKMKSLQGDNSLQPLESEAGE